jgi:hypothetical protein
MKAGDLVIVQVLMQGNYFIGCPGILIDRTAAIEGVSDSGWKCVIEYGKKSVDYWAPDFRISKY